MNDYVIPSLGVRTVFCAVMLIICIIETFALISIRTAKRRKAYVFFNALLLTADIMFFSLMSVYQIGYILTKKLTLPIVIIAEIILAFVPIFEIIFNTTRSRRVITEKSVKNALDNLPAGILFFDSDSFAVLTNHTMLTLLNELTDGDVRMMKQLDDVLNGKSPPASARRIDADDRTFIFSDGRIRTFEKSVIVCSGKKYSQFTANDVTDIYKIKQELEYDNELLRKASDNLRMLSQNVVTATREEEILNFKMQIHDDLGRSITAVRRYLTQNDSSQNADELIDMWRESVTLMKKDNETQTDDELGFLISSAEKMGLEIIIRGEMPSGSETAYTVISAVRTCLINAVRHADASKMYVDIKRGSDDIEIKITNNGIPPDGEITEGGGLSALRRRAEKNAGTMTVISRPKFAVIIKISAAQED